jgi:pseudouridine-5'-phosphate glycosidase/pseudouridine kinase
MQSPWRVDAPEAAAKIISRLPCCNSFRTRTDIVYAGAGQRLRLESGILFAAPIPEEYAGTAALIQDAVNRAIRESEENGMSKRGKEVTPWLLSRVAELTQGKSIPSSELTCEIWTFLDLNIWNRYCSHREHVFHRSVFTPNSGTSQPTI